MRFWQGSGTARGREGLRGGPRRSCEPGDNDPASRQRWVSRRATQGGGRLGCVGGGQLRPWGTVCFLHGVAPREVGVGCRNTKSNAINSNKTCEHTQTHVDFNRRRHSNTGVRTMVLFFHGSFWNFRVGQVLCTGERSSTLAWEFFIML